MGVSNFRNKEFCTVHHLLNRIAHRVFFLKDDERNDFLAMMLRVAEFTGIKLLGWCIMSNHFHILVFLPERVEVDEKEIVRRIGVLKGKKGADAFVAMLSTLRARDACGEANAQRLLAQQRRRMYNVGSFMKILKQWFTEEYNRRSSHVGTLWESTYIDRPVEFSRSGMEHVLAYVGLNPIRAGLCTSYEEYVWSSLWAVARGDTSAIEGLRFVYGDEMTVPEMRDALHERMDEMLETEKRQWAYEVARRRAAGYGIPHNPLTDEAYVAQAAAHREKVVQAGTELYERDVIYRKSAEKRRVIQLRIVEALRNDPTLPPSVLARNLEIPMTTIYDYVKDLVLKGALSRSKRSAPWVLDEMRITELGLT